VLRNRADVLAVIAFGGALGSMARWGLTLLWPPHPGAFGWATLTANVTGSLALGVLMIFVLDVLPPSRYARPFLGTGVLGGYTTFSTAMLDTRAQLVAGRPAQAGAYLFGGLAAGLLAVWLGMVTARAVVVAVRGRAARRRDRAEDLNERDGPDEPDRPNEHVNERDGPDEHRTAADPGAATPTPRPQATRRP
jgi:CrcB protein